MASLETHSFSSTLSVYVRGGSRFETYHQQGLTHLLKNAAFLVRVCVVCVMCDECVCVIGCRWEEYIQSASRNGQCWRLSLVGILYMHTSIHSCYV